MYYTYYSYETDKGIDGLGYIGYRKLKNADTPEEEDYYGTPSSPKNKDFKENENKAKIILGKFETEQEAIAHEIYLHELWAVDTNPHFANQAKQTSMGFRASLAGCGSSHPSCDNTLRDWTNDKLGIIEYNITTYDLKQKYKIDDSGISKVLRGIIRAYKGWRLVGSISDEEMKANKSYALSGKNNGAFDHTLRDWTNDKLGITEYNITTQDLCKKYPNLSLNALRRVIKGHSKTSGGGWRIC